MAQPVMNRQQGRPGEVGRVVPLPPEPGHSLANRIVFYLPRFLRHLRRRLKSRMSFGDAWRSARRRMWQYH